MLRGLEIAYVLLPTLVRNNIIKAVCMIIVECNISVVSCNNELC